MSATTAALIEAAVRAFDFDGDGEVAFEQIRQGCLNTPVHLQADLLAQFNGYAK
ncbi:MAG TPA: hypothetical protein VN629_08860 [Castellaniella sp.]|nr:hypothetical protein [Castellaniella sp.]